MKPIYLASVPLVDKVLQGSNPAQQFTVIALKTAFSLIGIFVIISLVIVLILLYGSSKMRNINRVICSILSLGAIIVGYFIFQFIWAIYTEGIEEGFLQRLNEMSFIELIELASSEAAKVFLIVPWAVTSAILFAILCIPMYIVIVVYLALMSSMRNIKDVTIFLIYLFLPIVLFWTNAAMEEFALVQFGSPVYYLIDIENTIQIVCVVVLIRQSYKYAVNGDRAQFIDDISGNNISPATVNSISVLFLIVSHLLMIYYTKTIIPPTLLIVMAVLIILLVCRRNASLAIGALLMFLYAKYGLRFGDIGRFPYFYRIKLYILKLLSIQAVDVAPLSNSVEVGRLISAPPDYDDKTTNRPSRPIGNERDAKSPKKKPWRCEIPSVTITQWPLTVKEGTFVDYMRPVDNGAPDERDLSKFYRFVVSASLLQPVIGTRFLIRIVMSEIPVFQLLFPHYRYHKFRGGSEVKKAYAEEKLQTLKVQFPGFDGIADVLSLSPSDLTEKGIQDGYRVNTYRLTVNDSPFIHPILLMSKILSSAAMSQDKMLSFWIPVCKTSSADAWKVTDKLWGLQKHLGANRVKSLSNCYGTDLYSLQVYAQTIVKDVHGANVDQKQYHRNVNAVLGSIAAEFASANGNPDAQAAFTECGPLALSLILKCALLHPIVITPACIDLNVNADPIIIPRALYLPGEDNPLVGDKRELNGAFSNRIVLGTKYLKGVPTQREALFNPADGLYSILIAGMPGVGKTTLLLNMMEGYRRIMPKVGILVINCAKQGEQRSYPGFQYYQYGKNLRLPYFASQETEGTLLKSALYECAKTLTAAYGLLDWCEKFFLTALEKYRAYYVRNTQCIRSGAAMKAQIDANGLETAIVPQEDMEDLTVVPDRFEILLDLVKKVVTDPQSQYAKDVQQNITQSVLQRNRLFISDTDFLKAAGYNGKNPKWLDRWLNGEAVFLDLSNASEVTQQILFFFLLNSINIVTQHRNQQKEKLRNLLVLDEAHRLIGNTLNFDFVSDNNIRQQYLVHKISQIFTEYRSRGIGFIISDQQPKKLMEEAGNVIPTKFLFRLSYEDGMLCTGDADLAQYINKLPSYHCVFVNKEGKRCTMKSLERDTEEDEDEEED